MVLHVPLLRFVNDLFATERRGSAVHALHCVARLVRCMLGREAIAPPKWAGDCSCKCSGSM